MSRSHAPIGPTHNWTNTEKQFAWGLYKAGVSEPNIAVQMNLRPAQVHSKIRALIEGRDKIKSLTPQVVPPVCNIPNPSPTALPTALADPENDPNKIAYWKKQALGLRKQLDEATMHETATEILVAEARDLAPQSYIPAPECHLNCKAPGSSPQSAVLMLSDAHIGQVVKPEQTLGFGEYNFDVFRRRLKRVEDSVVSILKDHTTTPVPELIIPMLGDMLDGALQHSAEVGQTNTLFTQFYGASHVLAQFLRNLSSIVPTIRVFTCVGNHTRWQNQHKMPTKNRFSNLDQFLYAHVKALVRDIPKIDFHLDRQPFAEFQVQNYTFLAGHGEHLRGGDKALGIPAHAMGRNISIESQLRAKCNRPGINYYLVGHVHRPMEIPHCQGEIITNGGFPGLDEFGMMEKFVACDPIQKFFLVHPKFGRSACYDLNLKFAKKGGPVPYEVPGDFPIV